MSGNGDLWIYLDIRKLRIAQNPILIEVKNIPLRNLHFFLITWESKIKGELPHCFIWCEAAWAQVKCTLIT